mgnify:CR=1 FL=1
MGNDLSQSWHIDEFDFNYLPGLYLTTLTLLTSFKNARIINLFQ